MDRPPRAIGKNWRRKKTLKRKANAGEHNKGVEHNKTQRVVKKSPWQSRAEKTKTKTHSNKCAINFHGKTRKGIFVSEAAMKIVSTTTTCTIQCKKQSNNNNKLRVASCQEVQVPGSLEKTQQEQEFFLLLFNKNKRVKYLCIF